MTIFERWQNKEKGFTNLGNFQTKLMQAFTYADGDNKAKLEKAFPKLFVEGRPKKLIGYQIEKKDNDHAEIPVGFNSWEILSERLADDWLKQNDPGGEWEKVEIFDQDIEEPKYLDGTAGLYHTTAKPSKNHP